MWQGVAAYQTGQAQLLLCCVAMKYVLWGLLLDNDHMIGDDNLRFTRLLDTTKELVMELARAGVHAKAIVRGHYVKAPPMVGPTWTRVRLTLGSDCFPALFQGTALSLPRASGTVYCSRAHDSMIWVIQGCISTSYLSMSPWGLFYVSYSVCLHGTSYPMTDYYVYNWRREIRPASADALQDSLRFHY